MDITYTGCFFDHDMASVLRRHRQGEELSKSIRALHMTIFYEPEEVDITLLGEEIRVHVVGYSNDGSNEGYLVEADSDNEKIKELLEQIEVQHITLSRAEEARSVDTKDLDFQPIEPFCVKGHFGIFVEGLGPVTGISK